MFEQLPTLSDRRIAVRLTADALRHVRAGHPWVFDDSIVSASHEGETGDLAIVFNNDRKFVGIGLFDPAGPIALRMVHRGKTATIDQAFWESKINAARAIRQPLLKCGAWLGRERVLVEPSLIHI